MISFIALHLALLASICALLCAAQSATNENLVTAFGNIRSDVYTLLQLFASSDSNVNKSDLQDMELALLQIAKDLDAASITSTQFQGTLNRSEQEEIAHYVVAAAGNVNEISVYILEIEDRIVHLGLKKFVASTLRCFESSVSHIAAVMPILDDDVRVWVGSSTIEAICKIDYTASVIDPGTHLTNKYFCDTYSDASQAVNSYDGSSSLSGDSDAYAVEPSSDSDSDAYGLSSSEPSDSDAYAASTAPLTVPDFPCLPVTLHVFDNCSQQCANLLKFGYQNDCFSKPDLCQNLNWCNTNGGKPFAPCTADWTPPTLVCH